MDSLDCKNENGLQLFKQLKPRLRMQAPIRAFKGGTNERLHLKVPARD